MSLRELAVYLVVAMSSLFLTAYTVHMLVGGLVSPDTEYTLMGVMCLVVVGVIGFMAHDVYRRRKGR
ncbi:MAG: hypothetical protein KGI47_00330 [Betaproteobacteria bacterium]|nr:hypothetical protein [Betaproteobacteria bacterium]MDE2622064.1 hypothetical protein [Betaproteobacteria bacterium]